MRLLASLYTIPGTRLPLAQLDNSVIIIWNGKRKVAQAGLNACYRLDNAMEMAGKIDY